MSYQSKKLPRAHRKKQRLTISLSSETRCYLEAARERAKSPSMSAYLESLVEDLRNREEMAALEAQAAAYYDHLSPKEIEEESEWGRAGAASVSRLED